MKRYAILKYILSTVLCVSCFLTTFTSVSATDGNVLPKGDSDVITTDMTEIEQLEELLLNSSSKQEREAVLKKAYQMGFNETDFTNISLSESDIEIFKGNLTTTNSVKNRAVLRASSSMASVASTTDIVAGVSMPDYALWPTIYKQYNKSSCSAATVYTVAKYIGATPPSQEEIMAFWFDEWKKPLPDLPLMRNYLNNHLSGKPSDYIPYAYKKYAGDQTTFNTMLKNNVLNYQPMILLIKNSSGTTNWPYTTNGHFCICSGLLTWENNKYFIGDPYYFTGYVSGATANNGEHKRTWTQLNNVITNKFGSGLQYCLSLNIS